jgi:hypothetical protein
MEPKDYEKNADRWLDGALKQYGEAEPRAGLERRILANLCNAEQASMRGWKSWAALAAVGLVIGAVIFVVQPSRDVPRIVVSTRARTQAASENLGQEPPISTEASSAPKAVPHSARRRQVFAIRLAKAVPQLDQFPSPQPVSAQDKPLLQYLRNAARSGVVRAAIDPQSLAEQKSADPFSAATATPPTWDLSLKQVATLTPDKLPHAPAVQN